MMFLSADGASSRMEDEMTATTSASETSLAFRYLFIFRRVVVSLAVLGAVLAWAYEFRALLAACVCVGIGELLESSYYISVLRWRERQSPRQSTASFTRITSHGRRDGRTLQAWRATSGVSG
jgi:hypothetical protein